MKARLLILSLILLVLGQSFTYGQSKKEKSKTEKELIASIDSMQIVIDSLEIQLMDRDSVATKNMITIDSLKNAIADLSIRSNQRIAFLRDSMSTENETRDNEILRIQSNIGFVDTCMVKLANRWLYEKFDKESVDEAITYFDRIYNNELKNELSIVQKLLRDYEPAYREFQSILKQAQDDIERTSPFGVDEYKEKYIRRIQTMSYYLQYYEGDWNIRYLNDKIKEALDRLQTHSDKKPADFNSLLD